MAKGFQIKKLDWNLITVVILLCTVGLVVIYSANAGMDEQVQVNNFQKQIIWMAIGIIIVVIMIMIPLKVFFAFAYIFYTGALLGLIFVLLQDNGGASERWISLGGLRLQPSEFAKIAIVLALARYLSQCKIQNNKLKDFIIVFIMVAIPVYLIKEQPDLGTSLVFLSLIIPLLYWAGIQPFTLFVLISPFLSVITSFQFIFFLCWMLIMTGVLYLSKKRLVVVMGLFLANIIVGFITPELWNNLEDYQKQRIKILFDPHQDARGTGYQVIQSMNAIGSGGSTGKGFLKGTQTQLRFLPEQNTDFIFSVLGEEFGFVGISTVFLLFFLLINRMISAAVNARNQFESLIVMGFASIILFHIFVNTGMTVNLMPVTGLPLPFLSYGGSFLITIMAMIGIVLNIVYKRGTYF